MSKKRSKKIEDAGQKVSPAQASEHEFRRSIKDLSTESLKCVLMENDKTLVCIHHAIAEFETKLKMARAELSIRARERRVLTSLIEERR